VTGIPAEPAPTAKPEPTPTTRRPPTIRTGTMKSNGRSTKPHEGVSDGKDGCALSVGSLFSGIGGLDLGFERAGFDIAWQCEKAPYCQKVLNKHWSNTPCYDNIEDLHRAEGPTPTADILIGGFPCQDISLAGKGAGLDGDRSGLWWEYARLIRVLEPRYAVLENVPALVNRGLQSILGWLAESGYDAEWQIVSAAAMGAPHLRERIFIVAYTPQHRVEKPAWQNRKPKRRGKSKGGVDTVRESSDVADAGVEERDRRPGLRPVFKGSVGRGRPYDRCLQRGRRKWKSEPRVGRLADGVSGRVDRLRGLGNAVVPQVAEYVALCVRQHASRTRDP